MFEIITVAFLAILFAILLPIGLIALIYTLILIVYLLLLGYAAIMVAVKNTIKAIKRRRSQQVLAPAKGKALDRLALMYGTRRQEKTIFGFIKVKESDRKLRLRLREMLLPSVREACYQINSEIRDRT